MIPRETDGSVPRMSQSPASAIPPLRLAALAAITCMTAGTARADEPNRQRAREAYEKGTAEFDAGEFAGAARSYLEADALAPSDTALEASYAALSSAGSISSVTAMFCGRIEERKNPPREIVKYRTLCDARDAAFGSFILECDASCTARFEDRTFGPGTPIAARPGAIQLDVDHAGRRSAMTMKVRAHARETLRLTAITSSPTAKDPPTSGVSPAWLGIAIGATAALGVATVVSGADTLAKHDEFEETRCGAPSASRPGATQAECNAAKDDGEAASLRTNVLLGVTAASAVATALFGLTAVDFGDDTNLSFVATPEMAAATARFRFE